MSRRLLFTLALVMAFTSLASAPKRFVTTDGRGHFLRGDSIYTFAGTNLWYAPILASDGRGGNPQRLQRELDRLQSLGVTNLRILAGAEGPEGLPHHISPVLQTAPGVYNDTLLTGLDRLMAELERRDMTAVIYLTNSWEWSGGYGSCRASTAIRNMWITSRSSCSMTRPARWPSTISASW